MSKALYSSLVLIFSTLVISSGCSKDNGGGGGGGSTTVDCATVTSKAFAANVSPIIQASCALAGCHATAGNGPGALTTYSQISTNAGAIRSAVSSGRMPQGSTLSTAQKNSIICWIDSGAPNN